MRKNSGFSLLELLTVIGTIAILLSIGLPNLLSYRQKAQLGKATRDIYGGLQKAKMEAARHNRFCVFRVSEITVNGTTYMYHAFCDESNPRNYVYDDGVDTFITGYRQNNYPGVSLDAGFGGGDGSTLPDVTGDPTIAFAPDGLPKDLNGNLTNGSLRFTNGGEKGQEVSVSLTGNIKITQYR